MAFDYPAETGTVTNWEEVLPNQNLPLLECLCLLVRTNFKGYDKFSLRSLRRKMQTSSSNTLGLPGLRVWRHTVANQEMAAFFFLRAKNTAVSYTPVHVLSVGVARNDFDVYAALVPLCRWMVGQDPMLLEILSETELLNNATLAGAFSKVTVNQILGKDQVSPGHPWPGTLVRWRLRP